MTNRTMNRLNIFLLVVVAFVTLSCSKATKGDEKIVENKENILVDSIKPMTKECFLTRISNYENSKDWNYLSDKPSVIYFYADWCRPCKDMNPIISDISLEYASSINFYKVNVDEDKELVKLFSVQGIPSFVFMAKTVLPKIVVGVQTKDDLKEDIFRIISE